MTDPTNPINESREPANAGGVPKTPDAGRGCRQTLVLIAIIPVSVTLSVLVGWLVAGLAETLIPDSGWRYFFSAPVLIPLLALLALAAGVCEILVIKIIHLIEWLGVKINALVHPYMQAIVSKMAVSKKEWTHEEFRTLVVEQIRSLRPPKDQNLLLMPMSIPLFFLIRSTLWIMKWILLGDFIEQLEKAGKTTVSALDVEAFSRERLTALIIEIFKEKWELVQYAIWSVVALANIGAIVAVWLIAI
ncbi:MAG: hypothetical protein ABIH86_05750 [Planctomycetota bacterium]